MIIGVGNILQITENDVGGNGQIIKNIVTSYDKFKVEFSKINCNFKKSQLWHNDAFRIGRGFNSIVKHEIFTEDELSHVNTIKVWTVGDLINNLTMMTREGIILTYGTNIRQESYRKSKGFIETAIKRYGKTEGDSISISEFFEGFKRAQEKLGIS